MGDDVRCAAARPINMESHADQLRAVQMLLAWLSYYSGEYTMSAASRRCGNMNPNMDSLVAIGSSQLSLQFCNLFSAD
jgi:hypothetical protein